MHDMLCRLRKYFHAMRLWAKMAIILQDGGAHKETFHPTGDGGSKLCMLCRNIWTETCNVCDEDGTDLLMCNVIKTANLVLATSKQLRKTARYLETKVGVMTGEKFTNLQQALGITHEPYGILLDRTLDTIVQPTEVFMHDWMHLLFVSGVANLVVYLTFESFIGNDRKEVYEHFRNYVSVWHWPGRLHGSGLSEIFTEKRKDSHREAKRIKCQASDMLCLIPVLALFVQTILLNTGLCGDECRAFLAMADMIELIFSTTRLKVDPETLKASVELFLELFVRAYGYDWMIPKFHWLLHLSIILGRFGVLLNCFALERKHRVPKRYSTEITNQSKYDSRSLLMEVTCHSLAGITNPKVFDFEIGLIGGKPATKKVRAMITSMLELTAHHEIQVAIESRFNALATCKRNDVILVKVGDASIKAAKVLLHFEVMNVSLSLVSMWDLHSSDSNLGISKWYATDATELIETHDILACLCHTKLRGGLVQVLLPPEFR